MSPAILSPADLGVRVREASRDLRRRGGVLPERVHRRRAQEYIAGAARQLGERLPT